MGLRELDQDRAAGGGADGSEVLEARLAAAVAAGRGAWPAVELDAARFVRHLAAQLPPGGDAVQAVAGLHATDLYLACACALGDPAALETFKRQLLPRLAPALRRLGLGAEAAEESLQALCVRLLVADGDRPPRIAEYSGRGPLWRWVAVVLAHLTANLRRGKANDDNREPLSGVHLVSQGPDPELECLKARSVADFDAAFSAALATLAARERNALRLHFVDGLSIDQIGVLHRLHRSTVARQINRAQVALLSATRRLLMQRLGLDARGADSLVDFVRSRIVSRLPAHLGRPADGDDPGR